MEDLGATEIARRSRRTPRVALRLLRRVRDFAQVMAEGIISLEVARDALNALGIDELGLDAMDRRILELILTRYKGGPVGLGTIAAVGEEADTIEDVYEPYLLQIGFSRRPAGAGWPARRPPPTSASPPRRRAPPDAPLLARSAQPPSR